MPMIENISTLVINQLSQEQYNRLVSENLLEQNQLYLTPSEEDGMIFIGEGAIILDQSGQPTISITTAYQTFIREIQKNKKIFLRTDISILSENSQYAFLDLKIVNTDSLIFGFSFNDGTNENSFSAILFENDQAALLYDTIITNSKFEEWWSEAEYKYVDSTSKYSSLPITEGAVWESFQRFTQLYKIQCNITLSDGIITSVELGYNEGKDLSTILAEAADAYNKSRGILLGDASKEIYLNGLMAVETLEDIQSGNSYKFIFDASHEEINVKNIIHLDANGFTCYHATLQPSLDIKNSLIKDEMNPVTSGAVYSEIQTVKNEIAEVASGRCKSFVFNDKAELVNVLNEETDDFFRNLKLGDVFLLRSVGEPDYWWEPIGEVAFLNEYTEQDIIIDGRGAARVLEPTKVNFENLDAYAKKDEDLDGLKFKRVYEYNSGLVSAADGYTEYDTENKKIYIWSNGTRGASQNPDPNTLYIIREV